MKKNSILAISAITLSFLLLGAVAAYITIDYFVNRIVPESVDLETEFHFILEEEFRQMESAQAVAPVSDAAPVSADSSSEGVPAVPDEIPSSPEETAVSADSSAIPESMIIETDDAELPDHQYIWIGDSRTVAIGKLVHDDCRFLGEDGIGYDWLVEKGDKQLQEEMKRSPGADVIFGFGVNDSENLELYLKYYQDLQKKYPDTSFYYLSVNPIDPARCAVISNEDIASFNQQLRSTFQDHYLNTFTWLMVNEAITVDGIHFDEETNRSLHDIVVKAIEGTAVLY